MNSTLLQRPNGNFHFRKAMRALPSSPSKKVEIVKSLATTFNLRIKLNNGGRPKNLLLKEEKDWLENFFMRPDITYITPGKNQQKYIGKKDGESQYAQIRYLLWNLNDLLQIANGNKLIDNSGFEEQFSKPITFRQLYEFIKEHPEFVYNKDTTVWVFVRGL